MFFSKNDISKTQTDVCLIVTILVVYNFFYFQNKSFNYNFDYEKMFLFASVIGFILHGLLTNKVSSFITKMLNINSDNAIFNTIHDIIKFGTLFITQQLITKGFSYDNILLDTNWQMESLGFLVGYTLFNFIQIALPPIGTSIGPEFNRLYLDGFKFTMGFIISQYMKTNEFTMTDFIMLGVYLIGWLIFHTFSVKLIIPVNELMEKNLGITSYANFKDE